MISKEDQGWEGHNSRQVTNECSKMIKMGRTIKINRICSALQLLQQLRLTSSGAN